ncbi:glyoxylase I family protein [Arthrobacter sp. PL16]|uniref:VOC family protein n=1 Tax=Arthrobacter sp. PL16 TaxID=3071720 RepID=UPI002DFF14A3|nr:glyoxylase I family protein [Arthrobacter sp. PL16]
MERVTGIGGMFFQARDPEALTRWYSDHLGVDVPPGSYDVSSWRQEAGATVFAALPVGSDHFPAGTAWAVTFRVRDLAAMVTQLEDAGIPVRRDPVSYPNGVFADLQDPEGHAIQLWQAAGADG